MVDKNTSNQGFKSNTATTLLNRNKGGGNQKNPLDIFKNKQLDTTTIKEALYSFDTDRSNLPEFMVLAI